MESYIFEIAKSYDTFDESHLNNDKVMKKCFDKLLSPIWQKWPNKPRNSLNDKKFQM